MAAPPIPKVGFQFPNNNLGQTPQSPGNIIALIGPCTRPQIALNEPRTLGGSPENVVSQAGYGPIADLAANLVEGGATVVVVPCDYTPATPSAVVKTGGGTSVMSVTGSPFDRYINVLVTVLRSGTPGDAIPPRIKVSLDNGLSETGAMNVPSSGVFSALAATTGMTFNFTVATLVEGAVYAFDVPYPTVTAADVTAAMLQLRQSTEDHSMIYVAAPFDRTDTETIWAMAGTFIPRKLFIWLMTESVDADGDTEAVWMQALKEDFDGSAVDFATVSAGYAPCRSTVLGSVMWRSIGWLAAVRASQVAVSRDLGAREDGALCPSGSVSTGGVIMTKPKANATNPLPLPAGYFIHDETLVPGLNESQFLTIMSEVGLAGYYITNPNIMSGPVSDYTLAQFRRTANEFARLTNIYFTLVLSGDILLNAQGLILEKEALKWEQGNNTACAALVTNQNVSSLGTVVGRNANIINFEPIPVDGKFQVKGYPKVFSVKIAMSRTAV
jgi:hypothetical protein